MRETNFNKIERNINIDLLYKEEKIMQKIIKQIIIVTQKIDLRLHQRIRKSIIMTFKE
jgi:hypothetical protein